MPKMMRGLIDYFNSLEVRGFLVNYEFVNSDGIDYNKVYNFLNSVSVSVKHPTTSTFIVMTTLTSEELGQKIIDFTISEFHKEEKNVRVLILSIPLDDKGNSIPPSFSHNLTNHSTGED